MLTVCAFPLCAVGPCALEYTKMKTADHFWTDPSADELVQRHRIHSSHCRQDSPTKRPALCVSGGRLGGGQLLAALTGVWSSSCLKRAVKPSGKRR